MRNNIRKFNKKEPDVIPGHAVLDINLHNRFDFEIVDSKTGEIKNKAQAENVVCPYLWTKLLNASSPSDWSGRAGDFMVNYDYNGQAQSYDVFFAGIVLGEGTGVPSAEDKTLFKKIGSNNTIKQTSVGILDLEETGIYGVYCTRKFILDETQLNDTYLTEIGITPSSFWQSYTGDYNSVCSHAMIKDMNGNQIVLHKTETDIINIYATVYADLTKYAPPSIYKEWPGEDTGIYITDIMNDLAKVLCGNVDGSRFYRRANPQFHVNKTGTENINVATVVAGYEKEARWVLKGNGLSPNSTDRTLTLTMDRLKVGESNCNGGLHGIGFFTIHNNGRTYKQGGQHFMYTQAIALYSGSGWYPGSNIIGESIATGDGETTEFRTKFGMVSNLKVYVDGVEDTGITYDENVPYNVNNMGNEFRPMKSKQDGVSPLIASDTSNWPLGGCPVPFGPSLDYTMYPRLVYGYWYNPLYEKGITKVKLGTVYTPSNNANYIAPEVACRNGCNEEWVVIPLDTTIPVEYQHYKYWRLLNGYFRFMNENLKSTNIHFSTPPAEGAVITADYFTKTIAKDSDHVFDTSITLKFGEAAPEE